MHHVRWGILIAVLVCSAAVHAATPAEVEKSITAAKAWLYTQQQSGNWEEVQAPDKAANYQSPRNGQFSGRTALAVLALLYSGESPQDARIKSAVDFLVKTPTEGVYALGLRCQVWLLLPPTPATKTAMTHDAQILLNSTKTTGNARGMYDYTPNASAGGKAYSHSRSQYAVLGLWAAAQSGVEVPEAYWKLIEEAWKRNQDKSGGWTYMNPADTDLAPTPGMTTVGVATMFIAQEYLRAQDGVLCKGNQTNESIDRGIKWLGENMDKLGSNTAYARDFPYPTLYAYERVGVASGLRYFGGVDWYEKGSTWAIKKQKPTGSWGSALGGPFSDVAETSFAMLFLAKGRAPVVISKLQYSNAAGKEGNWNQRSRDAANAVRWIGRTMERELSFQVVDLKASLEDMLESPLLYIAGNQAVTLSDPDKAKLKAYIEGGGIVLANADCGNALFATSIRKLGQELFPEAEFSELPQDDLIYTAYYPRKNWKSKPSVLTLNNGARQLMLLIPQADPARAWQLQAGKSRTEMFELPTDLLLYAVDRQALRYRGERYYLDDDPAAKAKITITITRLKYPGLWDPEPGGWRRLSILQKKSRAAAVATKTAELGKGELGTGESAKGKLAHLTGTFGRKFTAGELDDMKSFVAGGGTLVIDAAGGSSKFATSAENALVEMYPNDKLETLPPTHALYTAGGGAADPISYRNFAIRNGVGRTTAPRLQGITLNGRLSVIYSREDLSVGLVGQAVDGINGYSPATATNLMTRILAFAGGLPAIQPATQPATQPAVPSATKPVTKKPAKKPK